MAQNGNSEHFQKVMTPEGSPLERQVTYQLSPEQYERLFLQPNAAKGDLAKRLGNPTLLGLLGFLIPFQTTMFCLMEFKGSNATSLPGISGSWYFLGGIAMNIAGICEFVLGNTLPMAVFIIYGCHWVNIAYTGDPSHPLVAAYGTDGAAGKPWNSGQALYNITMTLVSFVFMLGALRTNVPFALAFFCLVFLFAFFAAGSWQIGYATGPADLERAAYLYKIAGGFGFVTALCGWYLAIITGCAATGVPCPLPIFDLSQKLFLGNKAQAGEHAGTVRPGSVSA